MNFDEIYESSLYVRPDPLSIEAFYDIELPDVHEEVTTTYGGQRFVWDRFKSNDNVRYHDFSHYLTATIYVDDEYALFDGSYVNGKRVNIETDYPNVGALLYSINLNLTPEKDVLVLVRQAKLDHDKIRLITCYGTQNLSYLELYWTNRKETPFKPEYDGDPSPEDFENVLKERKNIRNYVKNRTIDSLVNGSIRAYNAFIDKINSKDTNWHFLT